jgi:large repetitive protein
MSRPRHATSRRYSRYVTLAVGLGMGLTLALAGAAFAYWAVTAISGSGIYAEATSQTLPTGATPTASVSPASGQTVTITFAQVSSSGGTALTAYNVKRYLVGSSSGTSISGSCSVSASVVTCTDAPGLGSWNYTDTPTIVLSNWTGAESAKSATVIVQALPTLSVSASSAPVVNTALTPSATLAGATSTPAPGGSITFSVFGPQATAPTTCTGTGWSAVGSTVSVTGNGLYIASTSYTPTAAGTYWWYASYGGDTYNAAANSTCSATSSVVHLAVSPTSLPSATVYTAYSQAITASGGTSPYTYAETGSLPSGITLSSAGVLAGTDSAASQPGTYSFTVTATDHAGLTGTANYSLVVGAPTITLASLTNPTGEATYTQLASASGGQATYTYSLTSGTLPTGLSLNTSTGGFTGTSTHSGTFAFTITATDGHGYTGSQSYSLTPTAPTFTFAPTSLPTATVYAAYSQTLTASGGVSAYTYSESGTLPSGITLTAGGVLSGTDSAGSQAGSYPITVTSTDGDGFSGSTSYTLVVNAPAITLSSLTNPTAETTDTQSITATGGQSSYTYAKTSGTLPTGLSISTAGTFSGSPSAPSTFSFTITATDAHGYTGSQSYSLTPVAPTFTLTPSTLSSVTVYTAYSQTLSTSGGVSSYSYSESGTLPSSITLSSAGVLSGTDNAANQPGSYPITVTSTDADGFTGTKSYTLVVVAPNITLAALGNPTGEATYSQTASASGGQASYTYAKTSGTLPTGLSLNTSTGAISGTSTHSGTFTFTITATDANLYTGSQSYTLTPTTPAFTFAPTSLSAATVYVAYSQTITTGGGVSSYSYGETGTLPSGITLSSAGVLSGTDSAASQPGSYPITVTSTDADGFSNSNAYTLTVIAPTITLTPTTLPNGALGYNQQITATATGNSTDTFTYSITTGALPTGFTMTAGDIRAGITLTLGTYNFTVTATDANGYTGSRAYTILIVL